MDYQKQMDDLVNQIQDKLAEGISAIIRNINNKDKIVEFLKNLKDQPSVETVRRINKIAIEKEDYETCEAIKEYSKEKGITL
jgi:hypothetical protein